MPHRRGRGQRRGGAGGAGAGGSPLVSRSDPGRGADTAAGTTAPTGRPGGPRPGVAPTAGPGSGRGEVRPPCPPPARAGRPLTYPGKGWPRAGRAPPATRRGCGEPVGSQRSDRSPFLSPPRSVLRARRGTAAPTQTASHTPPRPTPGFTGLQRGAAAGPPSSLFAPAGVGSKAVPGRRADTRFCSCSRTAVLGSEAKAQRGWGKGEERGRTREPGCPSRPGRRVSRGESWAHGGAVRP